MCVGGGGGEEVRNLRVGRSSKEKIGDEGLVDVY